MAHANALFSSPLGSVTVLKRSSQFREGLSDMPG